MHRWHVIERFARTRNWTKGAELGVWEGHTFTHLIRTCKRLSMVGVDLYEPQPDNNGPEKYIAGENGHPWDHETYYNRMLQFCAQYPHRATIIKDYTSEAAKTIEDESLDFVFIDADHGYEGCLRDIDDWTPKVRKGGYVMGHDINWAGVNRAVKEVFGNTFKTEPDVVWWVEKQ